ncbi:MAG: hypothetical protein K0U84_14125 [Actinomycetia bacterium]|nr:hypothetical protein [Actinomycetes bacterium]
MPLRGQIVDGQLQLLSYPSSNERGFWLPQDERSGYTRDDPKRYRRFSAVELMERGEMPDGSPDPGQAVFDLYQQFNDVRDRGLFEMGITTRHTVLGRAREMKLAGWNAQIDLMRSVLEDAGLADDDIEDTLVRWGDLEDVRFEFDPSSDNWRIYGPGNQLMFDGDPSREERRILRAIEQRSDQAHDIAGRLQRELSGAGVDWSDLGISAGELDDMLAEPDGSFEAFIDLESNWRDMLPPEWTEVAGEELARAIEEDPDLFF